MSIRTSWSIGILVVCLALPTAARAQKMDKDDKSFLDSVEVIILTDEVKTYKGLKDKSDRQEFQKIFWARRDPDLETVENEYQLEYNSKVAGANTRYKVPGVPGSQTDCGRVFILLGEPDEVKKDQSGYAQMGRYPETWTYRGDSYQGGQVQIMFDAECRALATRLSEQLARMAQNLIAQPNIDYRVGKDGHLGKLADQLPKKSPAQALLKTPRQDFPVGAQAAYLKVQDGGTALVGLVRGEAAGLTTEELAGKKVVHVLVAAQAVGEDGKVAAFVEQKEVSAVEADGSFLGSFKMGLKPGKYTLFAGALEEKSGKGSLASMPIEVPDFNKGELAATLIIIKGWQPLPEGSSLDAQDAFSAFLLGKSQLFPRFGHTFSKAEALSFFYQAYDLKLDETTGKASGVASLMLFKEGKTPLAKSEESLQHAIAGNIIGPVPLEKYTPGAYVVQLKVKDTLASKEHVAEIPFEIKP